MYATFVRRADAQLIPFACGIPTPPRLSHSSLGGMEVECSVERARVKGVSDFQVMGAESVQFAQASRSLSVVSSPPHLRRFTPRGTRPVARATLD
jgi:hypothetical protein